VEGAAKVKLALVPHQVRDAREHEMPRRPLELQLRAKQAVELRRAEVIAQHLRGAIERVGRALLDELANEHDLCESEG
jgi:hypothetical protein